MNVRTCRDPLGVAVHGWPRARSAAMSGVRSPSGLPPGLIGSPGNLYCRTVDVDWNAELVDQLEWHWQHQLRPRLDGLTDDEYFWQPVPGCRTLSRHGQSSAPMLVGVGEFTLDYARPPHDREPVTTIAWRLAHLIDVFGPATAPHFDGPVASCPALAYPGTAEAALRQLDDGHDAWIRDVRHHGAEISLLRDLYLWKDSRGHL
jgi:DinB family protein